MARSWPPLSQWAAPWHFLTAGHRCPAAAAAAGLQACSSQKTSGDVGGAYA